MISVNLRVAVLASLALGAALAVPGAPALAQGESPFVICEDQRYALCATAQCFVYNEVAYCACDIKKGDSISLALSYDSPTGEKNACDVIQEGRFNGFLVSTYSFPDQARKGGTGAVYTCPGILDTAGGVPAPVGYAQCDGGLCFTSTNARRFPGFPERLGLDQIICSCPISTKEPGSEDPLGWQMFGPFDPQAPPGQRCDPSHCQLCGTDEPTATGTTLPVGSPAGTAEMLTVLLDGPPPPETNHCQCKCTKADDGTTSCTLAGES